MVRPGRERLTGAVEVDETFVGGVEPGGGRRHLGKKALVVVAAEVRGPAIGRIRLRRVADSAAASLLPFVHEAITPGTVVITDGLQSYRGLPEVGYRHDRRVLLGSGEAADAVLSRVHRVASLLKRWLLGTHQGAVSREHLDYYLDEFTFRFNRRTSRHRGKLFYRLLEKAVAVDPAPYAAMVKDVRGRRAQATASPPVVGTGVKDIPPMQARRGASALAARGVREAGRATAAGEASGYGNRGERERATLRAAGALATKSGEAN